MVNGEDGSLVFPFTIHHSPFTALHFCCVCAGGWAGIFNMLGFLSLSLGIFNLLPIPVLDGGAIFLLGVEAVMALGGWKLSMRVRERIQQVGFVMLLLLMGFVITNDLIKKVSRAPEETKPPAAAQPQK